MKAGDKVYCYNTITPIRNKRTKELYNISEIITKGNYYTIEEIRDGFYRIQSNKKDYYYFFTIKKTKPPRLSFDDYFITTQKYRKLKLKKLKK